MTSLRQIAANRRNALHSTGPVTPEGKQQSRRNAVRHGLTAETVIGTLEDAEDYKAFEAAVIADYDAHSAVERELVLRLASLLWRLRRAITIESGLFELESERIQEDAAAHPRHTGRDPVPWDRKALAETGSPALELATCFLHLARRPDHALDRLSRYELRLWRQASRIILILDTPAGRHQPKGSGRFIFRRPYGSDAQEL